MGNEKKLKNNKNGEKDQLVGRREEFERNSKVDLIMTTSLYFDLFFMTVFDFQTYDD